MVNRKLPFPCCALAIDDKEYVVPSPNSIPAFLQTASNDVIKGNS